MSANSIHPGRLHRIDRSTPVNGGEGTFALPPLVAFEHYPSSKRSADSNDLNTIIFLGGLSDGLLTVPFVVPVATTLPSHWALVEPILNSAYRQWGISSLDGDVEEVALLVKYFRDLRPNAQVVLLGHSTGSQVVMHYLLSAGSPSIEGAIMQASISDREAMTMTLPSDTYESICKMAQEYVASEKGEHILPLSTTESIFDVVPVSARRWLSLASPGHDGEDDYFSSDLGDERLEQTFGRIGKTDARLCFLYGGEDQYVPDIVDKEKLLKRWHRMIQKVGGKVDESSGNVLGASHTLKEGGPGLDELVRRVLGFVERIDKVMR